MKLTFVGQREEVPGVHTFIFTPEREIAWRPGQYMHYNLPHPGADSRGVERWFTISSAPYEKELHITTRIQGKKGSSFKKTLLGLRPGAEIEADGPKGNFTLREGAPHHVLVAGGIGITPYRSMLAQLAHDKVEAKADLLYANNDDNFVFMNELARFAKNDATFKIYKFVGTRISADDLKPYMDNPEAVFYLSGPEAMVENYEELLTGYGVDKENIATDYFPGY